MSIRHAGTLWLIAGLVAGCGGGGTGPNSAATPTAPTTLGYALNPATYTKGVAIAPNVATTKGGSPSAFAIAPALPAGLVMDSTTGTLSGTPAVLSAATSFTVTASNAAGSTQATLVLSVKEQPPAGLAYDVNPAIHTVGMAIVPNLPHASGGPIVTYAVAPPLPAGLGLDALSGVISGTPTATAPTADYTITGSNAGGSTTCLLSLTVNPGVPLITTQPSDLTVSVNRRAAFMVATDAPGATFQWKRNGVAIPGATAGIYEIPFVSLADDQVYFTVDVQASNLTVTSRAARLTVTSLAPVPTTYTSFNGQALNLFAWEGRYTAVLSRNDTLPVADMIKILAATDATYLYYQMATGYTPAPAKLYNGKLTLADVPATCGAGCGYLGATGIELQNTYFDILTNRVHADSQFDQVFFYEFGRNFWHLANKLECVGADNTGTITTGFAVFMRFMAMDAAAVEGAPYSTWSYAEFRTRVEGMYYLYGAESTATWSNTLKVGHPQATNPSGLGATDLFASFCFDLWRDFGVGAINKLWIEAAKRPNAATTQEAVDNFFLAACAATGKNLTTRVETTWRWPLSESAKQAALAYPN